MINFRINSWIWFFHRLGFRDFAPLLVTAGFFKNNKVMISNKSYMTVKEFADKNSITPKTVYAWINDGIVEKKKLGSATFVRFK